MRGGEGEAGEGAKGYKEKYMQKPRRDTNKEGIQQPLGYKQLFPLCSHLWKGYSM